MFTSPYEAQDVFSRNEKNLKKGSFDGTLSSLSDKTKTFHYSNQYRSFFFFIEAGWNLYKTFE
jgi:hypothetical protein